MQVLPTVGQQVKQVGLDKVSELYTITKLGSNGKGYGTAFYMHRDSASYHEEVDILVTLAGTGDWIVSKYSVGAGKRVEFIK